MSTNQHILRQWPARTSIHDYGMASTPEEIHAVSLGLEWVRWVRRKPLATENMWDPPLVALTATQWVYEGLALESVDPTWRRWDPNVLAPEWFNVRDYTGTPQRAVRVKSYVPPVDRWYPPAVLALGLKDAPPPPDWSEDWVDPGLLWLRAWANRHPLIYCPQGLGGGGSVITPDIGIAIRSEGDALAVAAAITKVGWPGPFPVIDIRDPKTITKVFGGYFTPGNWHFDPLMCLLLSRGVRVPGFHKLGDPSAGLSVRGGRFGFRT